MALHHTKWLYFTINGSTSLNMTLFDCRTLLYTIVYSGVEESEVEPRQSVVESSKVM